jgi:hypothetical protein
MGQKSCVFSLPPKSVVQQLLHGMHEVARRTMEDIDKPQGSQSSGERGHVLDVFDARTEDFGTTGNSSIQTNYDQHSVSVAEQLLLSALAQALTDHEIVLADHHASPWHGNCVGGRPS